jgi:hypothetical protein
MQMQHNRLASSVGALSAAAFAVALGAPAIAAEVKYDPGDDVKFTYERILDPKVGSGGRGYLSAIETIEVPDPLTVRIVTKQPSASLLAGMAGGWSN